MEYIKETSGLVERRGLSRVAAEREIRALFPNTSLPRRLDESILVSHGYLLLRPTTKPSGDIVTEGEPEKMEGEWRQTWVVRDFTEEERAERSEQVSAERRAGILEERARRIAMGFEYDFGDERGVHYIQTRPADEEGWKQVDRWAAAMTGLGDDTSTLLISTGTGPVQATAPEWHALVAYGASVQQPIWQASFVLRAMDPVPEDYADDKWWP